MNADERRIIAEAVEVMHGLRGEMQEFRGEMREFKENSSEFKQTVITRITGLETGATECQKNPAICATARALESHMKEHKGAKGLAVSIWAVCVSTMMCIFTIVITLVKRS